jgi:signal transduction histidine kinase
VPDTSWRPNRTDAWSQDTAIAAAGPTQARPAQARPARATPRARPLIARPSLAWLLLLWLLSLVAFVVFARREVLLFYVIWVGFGLLWGFRVSGVKPTLWLLATMVGTAIAAVAIYGAWRHNPAEQLAAVALLAAVFGARVWLARRKQSAFAEQARASEEQGRLLATQRRFLQDASHQLRTPITIALGHAELLARELSGRGEQRDIHVVVGELTRLKRLSERLLVIAASEDPEFLRLETVALDNFIMEVLRRWLPAAERHWRLGHLEPVTVRADRERLGLAVDALLENAVKHTEPGDAIILSVLRDDPHAPARLVIEDTGEGIAPEQLNSIFERFQTGSGDGGHRGTGLGLALVRAIVRGHDGEVCVQSTPGAGSRFELMIPAHGPAHGPMLSEPADPGGAFSDIDMKLR